MTTKTLLLVFIHGFKGGEHTFEGFPDHFRALIQNALPKINVLAVVYPKFETRGELGECVARFKEWLQDKVIDLEVLAHTPSPTVDPSVRVALIGHSMGGIVAAETLLSIARDQPVPARTISSTPPPGVGDRSSSNPNTANNSSINLNLPIAEPRPSSAPPQERPPPATDPTEDSLPTFLFPYVQAVLAFDTPYLGIHPGVIAHGAETHYNTASAAYNAYNQASRFFGVSPASVPAPPVNSSQPALPLPSSDAGWGKWGRYAMFAGGAAAVAAAGGAVWKSRDHITKGWAWAGSHLEFVGCLARSAELTQRVEAVVRLGQHHAIGFADFYTCLDKDKQGKTYYSEQLLGEERTFCVVPKEAKDPRGDLPSNKRKLAHAVEKRAKSKGTWIKCINEKAQNEVAAHVAMFTPKDNPDYYAMVDRAKTFLLKSVDKTWYESSEQSSTEGEQPSITEEEQPPITEEEQQSEGKSSTEEQQSQTGAQPMEA